MLVTILGESDAEQYWDLRLEALKNNPEAFATSYEEALARKDPIKQARENLTSEGILTFGAFEEERLVGTVTLVFFNKPKMKHKAEIVGMYVNPEYRKKRVGKELMNKAIQTARKVSNVEQLLLAVTAHNTPAVKLYESIGFKKYGTEPKAIKINDQYFHEDLMVMFL